MNHDILLRKLDNYGIRGNCQQCFKSFLTERKQHVYHNGHSYDLKEISCGVPQGSVLGPLIFLIYINDFPNVSKIFSLFTDDTNIIL